MAELRRILITPQRLAGCGQDVELTSDERHYLEKVLRLRPGSTAGRGGAAKETQMLTQKSTDGHGERAKRKCC